MDETFHPSTLGEILDRTAQLYRARFLAFLGIAFIPAAALLVPIVAVSLCFAWTGTHSGNYAAVLGGVLGMLAVGLIALPIFVGVSALASGAMSHAASRVILGQATTIRDAYKAVWPRGWRCVGIYLIEILAVWVAPYASWFALLMFSTALTALAGIAGIGGGGFFAFISFLIVIGLVSYGVWMSIRLSLAFPACVIEQIDAWAALKRSSSLVDGTKRRILLLYLLGMALSTILSIAIIVPLIIVLTLLPAFRSPEHAQALGTAALFIVCGARFAVRAITRPVYGIALMLFYYDQRIRQEAFDIEWMMLKAGLTVPSPQPEPWLPPALVMGNPPPENAPAPSPKLPAALFVESATEPISVGLPSHPNAPAN
jgi:hypothetical protein